MSVPSQLKSATLGAIGGVAGAAIVAIALGDWATMSAVDRVATPTVDTMALGQFGPTYDTLFAPPVYPIQLAPPAAPMQPPSEQSGPQAVVT